MLMAFLVGKEGNLRSGESIVLSNPVSIDMDTDFGSWLKRLFPQLKIFQRDIFFDFVCDICGFCPSCTIIRSLDGNLLQSGFDVVAIPLSIVEGDTRNLLVIEIEADDTIASCIGFLLPSIA